MLTVLCPDVPLQDAADRRWPALLSSRLRRAAVRARHRDTAPIPALAPLESWLAGRFGLNLSGTTTVAAFQRFAYGHDSTTPDEAFTVTPVCLRAGMDHLVLQPAQALDIRPDEAAQLIEAANAFLAQDGISLTALGPDCWLLHCPETLQLDLRSSMQASGRNVHAYMPAGADGRRLRSILNELQMLWHDHAVNADRHASGLPPVNSIWVEGQARANTNPPPIRQPFASVFTDNPVTQGLAADSGLALSDTVAPLQAADTAQLLALRGHVLLEFSGSDGLDRLDHLLRSWPRKLEISFTDDREWIDVLCSPFDKWRFWRRTRVASPGSTTR